jgi:hypothetical protein
LARWIIENRRSGTEVGRYSTETRQGALEAMARDVGYRTYADAIEAEPADYAELHVAKIPGTK